MLSSKLIEQKNDQLKVWNNFISALFQSKQMDSEKNMKFKDVLFQIIFYAYHNGRKMTPLHMSIAQTVHSYTRSKKLVTLFNRLGLSVSNDTRERVDVGLCKKRMEILPAGHRVPVNTDELTEDPLNGAIDNFDSGSSHDTIMIIFQNQTTTLRLDSDRVISKLPADEQKRDRATKKILPCQERLNFGPLQNRGALKSEFKSTEYVDDKTESCDIDKDFFMWLFLRYGCTERVAVRFLSSFTATRAMLPTCKQRNVTKTIFTPIIPFPVTEMDSVLTAMKNFLDVVTQAKQKCGALWCDEQVYAIAREIKMIKEGTVTII